MKELRLWSRTWGHTFDVSIAWDVGATGGNDGGVEIEKSLTGRVACEWEETGAIPALEEAVSFLPEWARVTKRADGLLEGYKKFVLG